MNKLKILFNGILKENPTFVLLIGMCPTLATTTSAINALGMGLSTAFVLTCSNIAIAALKNFIPDNVRIPAFVIIIASFVTLVQLVMEAYVPVLYASLGIYIPLIVVNCIILARAEAFANKNSVMDSMFDGLGMGLGFTLALTILGSVREMLGSGSFFNMKFIGDNDGILIFVLAPGAFITLGYIIALINRLSRKKS
ncbi:MAG TPA: electron transport complex subunit RsxE [Bacteroidales bacterium]|nr:electron transport complex subunit RsxE [Bacteroidales bacterium]